MSSTVGSISQLVAKGHMNKYLNTNPDVTFFRFQAMRHTMFALENVSLEFEGGSGNIGQNSKSSVRLHRSGDLVYGMFCVIDLPGIANVSVDNLCSDYGGNLSTSDDVSYAEIVHGHIPTERYKEIKDGKGCAVQDTQVTRTLPSGRTIVGEGVPYWTNGVGQFLIKEATVSIGSSPIDTLYNDYLFIFEELNGKPGRRLTDMIGKSNSEHELRIKSKFFRKLYVPLPFFFTKQSGCALPLVSLQFHDVEIKITWEGVANAIVNSSGMKNGTVALTSDAAKRFRTVVRPGQDMEGTMLNGVLATWGSSSKHEQTLPPVITDTDVKCRLECTYVYLDVAERAKFAEGSFEIMIDEVQSLPPHQQKQSNVCDINLNFNHAVMEIYWVVRQKLHEDLCEWFNYDGLTEPLTQLSLDPIQQVELRLNNQQRMETREGKWFRTMGPYMSHTNVPDSCVYSYCFALNPEDMQPSGTCNFSRIDSSTLRLTLDKHLYTDNSSVGGLDLSSTGVVTGGNSVTVVCFARNWNVLRITLGLAGKAFAN